VLLIVPGLILLTWWIVIIPVIVLEERSAGEAFSRSRELVRGHGWNVFGVIVLTILLVIAFQIVLSLLLLPVSEWLRSFVSNLVSGTVVTPFIVLVWTTLYYRLRAAKEPPADAPATPA
jgi:Membrane domain of glycerophosphoryl diester phosphodiesterase